MTAGYSIRHFSLAEGVFNDVFQKIDDEFSVFEFFRLCLGTDLVDDVLRRRHGNIRRDQNLFQLVVKFVAQFIFGKQRGQFGGNVVPRLFERADDLAEKSHKTSLYTHFSRAKAVRKAVVCGNANELFAFTRIAGNILPRFS